VTKEGEGRLALALGLVAGTCVYAFSRVFSGRAWLIPALAAAWGGIALTRWLAHLRIPRVVATFVVAVVGAFAVLLVVFPQTTFFGLPGPGSLQHALATLRAANGSIADVTAPIPADPGYLALAMAAAWIAGALSGALIGSPHRAAGARTEERGGLRSLSPSLAAPLPWIVLFTIAAGVGQGRGRLFVAALFFTAVLAYLLAESWSGLGRLPKLDGAIRLGALSLAGAILLPNLVPGYRAGPVFPWARIGPLTETTVSPLVQIKPFLLNQPNVALFNVAADQSAYWRLTSLDHFDGNTWSSQGTYNPAAGVLATPSPAIASQVVHQQYTISGLGGIWVPAAYEVTRVAGLKTSIDPTTQTLIVGALHAGTSYDLVSASPEPTGAQLSAAGAGPAPRPEDLALPAPTVSLIRPLTLQIVGSTTNAYDAAVAIQRYLRSFTYDEHVQADSSTNYLYDFLTRTKAGFCQQFAGAMAVMLRTLGIPARVAVGFLPGTPTIGTSGTTTFLVSGRHAHAWPEAFFQGIGWVAFEDAPPPNYTVAPAPVTAPTTVASPSPEASQASSPAPSTPQPARSPAEAPRKVSHPAITAARRASYILLIALLAVLVALLGAREARLRLAGWTAGSATEKAVAAYQEFALRAGDAIGERRRSGETEAEYARSVVQALSLPAGAAAEVAALTRAYQRATYSLQAPSAAELEAALGANRALRRQLWKGADRRGKIRLAFSPRPLATRSGGGTRADAYDRPRSRRAPSAARRV
jgi:transglutaminase-like putative cysteine protease